MNKLFLLVCLPILALGQSDYWETPVIISCWGESNESSKTLNLSEAQVHWDTLLIFPEASKKRKKAIEIDDFQLIQPKELLQPNAHQFDNERRSATIFAAPNAFLFQSNNNVAVANDGAVYAQTYDGLVNDFGYDYYIKRTEVSNAEYREFVNYVRDSLALELLAKVDSAKFRVYNPDGTSRLDWNVKWKKIWEDENYAQVLDALYYGDDDERFYKRKQLDTDLFYYKYRKDDGTDDSIHIFPDTLKWVHDFNYTWNEPMAQMYFWHPVYDNYPVTGVSYNQAKAYLHWLSKRGVKDLDKKDIEYEIGLPKPEEVEYAVAALGTEMDQKNDEPNSSLFNFYRDKNVAFDLVLRDNHRWQNMYFSKDSAVTNEYLKNQTVTGFFNPYTTHFGSFVEDGGLHTLPGDLSGHPQKNLHSINGKIYHLNGNVSEFLDMRFSDYKAFVQLKIAALLQSPYPAVAELGEELQKRAANFKDDDPLVMGGNWFDEHYEQSFGVALKGIYSKTFLHPDSAHSTIGFRYVVRLKNNAPPPESRVQNRKLQTISIFTELQNAGFVLDSAIDINTLQQYDKITFYNQKVDALIKAEKKSNEISVLDGVYIRAHKSSRQGAKNTRIFSKYYPELLKKIEAVGGLENSFLSELPNGSPKVFMRYGIKFINEYTLELIRL